MDEQGLYETETSTEIDFQWLNNKIWTQKHPEEKCILSRYSPCPFTVPSVQILEDMGVVLGDTSFKISSVQRQVFTVTR